MCRRSLRLAGYAVGALLATCVIAVSAPDAQAAGIGSASIEGIANALNRVRAFEGALMNQAQLLFAGLALIEFVLVVGKQVIARADVVGILATILFQVVTLGFFYWLCIHGPDMSRAITTSFAQVANDASVAAGGSRNLSPGDVFELGLELVKATWAPLGFNIKSVLLIFAGLAILAVFSMVTGMMVEVIVESYFTASVGVILLGFGGASFTRSLAVAQLHLAIAVGMKRLVLQLLVGLSEVLMRGWIGTVGTDPTWVEIAVMVGVPIVLLRLVTTLPLRAQEMIMGTHSHQGLGLGDVPRMAAATAASAAASTVGGAAATAAAFKEASAQISAREGGGSGGSVSKGGGGQGAMAGMSRAAQVTGMAVGNLSKAAAQDIGQRMSGSYAAQHGRAGFRMAGAMNARADAMRGAAGSGSTPMASGSTQNPGNQVGAARAQS